MVQSGEGLNLRRSAKGHGDESSHRRTTARPPHAIPDSRLVGSVEDSSRQLLRRVILQESGTVQLRPSDRARFRVTLLR